MYKNNDFIYDASVQFEQLTNIPVEVESNRKAHGAVLTMNHIQFVVQAESEIRTSNFI